MITHASLAAPLIEEFSLVRWSMLKCGVVVYAVPPICWAYRRMNGLSARFLLPFGVRDGILVILPMGWWRSGTPRCGKFGTSIS